MTNLVAAITNSRMSVVPSRSAMSHDQILQREFAVLDESE